LLSSSHDLRVSGFPITLSPILAASWLISIPHVIVVGRGAATARSLRRSSASTGLVRLGLFELRALFFELGTLSKILLAIEK